MHFSSSILTVMCVCKYLLSPIECAFYHRPTEMASRAYRALCETVDTAQLGNYIKMVTWLKRLRHKLLALPLEKNTVMDFFGKHTSLFPSN